MKMTRTLLTAGLAPFLAEAHPHDPPVDGRAALTVAAQTGTGAMQFRNIPGWGAMPQGETLGKTNGSIAVDTAGLIYVSTDGPHGILVFSPDGKLARTIPLSRAHGLFIHEENGVESLWASHATGPRLVQMTLEGKELFQIPNDKTGEVKGGFKGITAATIAPDGSIYVAIGYGSNFIHHFDAEGRHLKTFAGKGKGDAQCHTAHGIGLDTRFDPPRLLVADRENNRVTHFGLDGSWLGVHAAGLRRPTDLSFRGKLVAVSELGGRVSILRKNGKAAARLGDNPDEKQRANPKVDPKDLAPGLFSAPHGVSFDAWGNLFVQDWNNFGRLTKLERLAPKKNAQ
jgi:hypothetical protein